MSPDRLAPDRKLEAMLDRLLRPLARAAEDAVQRLGLAIDTAPETEAADPSEDSAAPTPARRGDGHRQPAADAEAGPVRAPAGADAAGTIAPMAGAATNRGTGDGALHTAAAPTGPAAATRDVDGLVGGDRAASAPPPTAGWPTPRPSLSVAPEPYRAERRIEAAPTPGPGPVTSRYDSASAPTTAASSAAETRPAPPEPPATRESTSGIAPRDTTATISLAAGAVPVRAAPDRPVGDGGGGNAAETFGTSPEPLHGAAIESHGIHVAAPLAAPDRHAPPRAVAPESAGDPATGADSTPPLPPTPSASTASGATAPASSHATPTVLARAAAVRAAVAASGLLRLVRAPAVEGTAALPDGPPALTSAADPLVPSVSSMTDPAGPLPQVPSRELRAVATRLDRALAPVFSRAAAATWEAGSAQADDLAGSRSSAAAVDASDAVSGPGGAPATQISNTFNVKVSMTGSGSATDARQLEEQVADWLRASARRQGLLA